MVVIVGASLVPLGLVAAYAIANFRPLWLLGVFGLAAAVVIMTRIELAALALAIAIFLPDIGKDIPGPFALFVHDLLILGLFGLYAGRQIAAGGRIVQMDPAALKWLAAFIAISGASLIKAMALDRPIFLAGLKDWIRLVELLLMMIALSGVMDSPERMARMLKALLIAAAAALATAFWAYAADSDAFYKLMDLKRATVQVSGLHYRMISTMGSAAHTAVSFAIVAALSTALLWRGGGRLRTFVSLALIVASIVCVGLTFSKGTWVSILVALVILWISGRLPRAWTYAAAIMLVAAALALVALWPSELDPGAVATDFFRLSRSSAEIRLERWASAWQVLITEPFFGVGYNVYAYIYGKFALESNISFEYGHPHNMYVDMLTGTGVLGLAAFLGFISRLLSIAKRLRAGEGLEPSLSALGRACYLALLIFFCGSLFNSYMFKAGRAAMLMFAVAAMVMALERHRLKVQDGGHGGGVSRERELEGPVGQQKLFRA